MKREEPPLEETKKQFGDQHELTQTKGIVTLSRHWWDVPPGEIDPKELTAKFHLDWQQVSELQADQGVAHYVQVLSERRLLLLDGDQLERLVAEIRPKVAPEVWPAVLKQIGEIPGARREAAVVALWAEVLTEPGSSLWLAAMARHADLTGDNFAFGYLTALLDQRESNEADVMRGRKSVRSGKSGGEMVAHAKRAAALPIVNAMGELISLGHTISRAGEIVHRKHGLGTSGGANVKLWHRHKKRK